MVYTEDVSKSKEGCCTMIEYSSRNVSHYENVDYPQCHLVRLYKLYNEKCPIDRPPNSFYLKPLKNPKGQLWFQKIPLGHNTLSNMISRIMPAVNIIGRFTNHSLRSNATTRLFSARVDEQLIIYTSHTSTKGVCSYKNISDQILQETQGCSLLRG